MFKESVIVSEKQQLNRWGMTVTTGQRFLASVGSLNILRSFPMHCGMARYSINVQWQRMRIKGGGKSGNND